MGPPERAQRVDAGSHPGRRDRRLPRSDLTVLKPAPGFQAWAPVCCFAGRETIVGRPGETNSNTATFLQLWRATPLAVAGEIRPGKSGRSAGKNARQG